MKDKAAVYERIKAYLFWNGIPQKDFARRMYLTLHAFSNAMNGKVALTIDRYLKICQLLDLPQTYFLDDAQWREIPEYCFYTYHRQKEK